jgi:phenylpropionate dioxygenase-like ring-hydroxylating dioxygenase large terminal subunit
MLISESRIWRRFWHAVIPLDRLRDGPQAFTLLTEKIVLFLDRDGLPVALQDRCRHRTAQLSKGCVRDGMIACAYHGWQYDRSGRLTLIPQNRPGAKLPEANVKAFHCQARYGYAWVALDPPILPIVEIPEEQDAGFRRIHQFYETWKTSPLRLIENSFDNAHFSFVHKGTFGNIAQPEPGRYTIEETEQGFYAEAVTGALNPPAAYPVSGSTEPTIDRLLRSSWTMPFTRRFDMEYASGIRHIIITYATPIDDNHIQVTQFLYRNDSEAQCPAQLLIDWDARILAEDKDVLEATDPDVTLDVTDPAEMHMLSDRPSVIMRKRIAQLLQSDAATLPALDIASLKP